LPWPVPRAAKLVVVSTYFCRTEELRKLAVPFNAMLLMTQHSEADGDAGRIFGWMIKLKLGDLLKWQ